MKYQFGKIIILALGGSIVFPGHIDWEFLKRLITFIKRYSARGKQFVIVVGGGRLSRMYIEAASKVTKVSNEDKDWLGIHATRSNAHLLRTIFRDIANPVVIDERYKIKKLTFPVTVASGWQPGRSSDYVAAACAHDFGAKEFIVAGKPSHVYDKDNTEYKDARPFRELIWSEYRKLIPTKWTPGAHTPVDPVTARLAQKKKLTAIVINGKNLENFGNLLSGKHFEGTIVH